ncbi:MAG TPA: cytochrome c biogenesis protein CcsA [Longimicrobiales bacterium]
MDALTSRRGSRVPLRPGRTSNVLGWIALLALAGAQAFGFAVSRPERDMGHLQKILYVHVPVAWTMLIAYTIVFVASLLYLWRRDERFDLYAAATAEVGVVLTALTLALGSIWARPTWGVWWTWDPRLTTSAILLVIYAGYLALRSFTEDAERRARWSAAVGILGYLNVFIVYQSVRWWRSIHQVQSSPSTVDPTYAWALRLNAIAFLLVLAYLAGRRYHAARLERAADARLEEAALTDGGVHV